MGLSSEEEEEEEAHSVLQHRYTKTMGIAAVRAIARMRFRVWGHAFDNGRVARCLTTAENDRIHLRALQACWDSFRLSTFDLVGKVLSVPSVLVYSLGILGRQVDLSSYFIYFNLKAYNNILIF